MPYTKQHDPWADYPDTSTPITATDLDGMETGIATAQTAAEAAQTDATAAQGDIDAHIADTTDAHDASAISVADSGSFFTGTDVESVLQEIAPQLGSSGATAVTALPGSPSDGDEIILMDSLSAPTYAWHLRYISAKSSNKWQFLGGPPLYAEVTTAESTSGTSYGALTTAGPTVTLPVAGDYIIEHGYRNSSKASAGNSTSLMSYDIGGTGAVDADAVQVSINSTSNTSGANITRRRKKTGLTAVALTAKYKVSGDTMGFADRWISAIPIAIGG